MAFWSHRDAAPVQSHKFKVEWIGLGEGVVLPFTVKSCTKPSVEITSGEYQVGNQVFKYPGIHKWNDITLVYVDDKETTRRAIKMLMDHNWLNPVRGTSTSIVKDSADKLKQWPYIHSNYEGIKKTVGGGGRELIITQYGVLSKLVQTTPERESTFLRPGAPAVHKVGHSGDGLRREPGVTRSTPRRLGDDEGGYGFLEKWQLKNCWIKSINFGQLDYSSDELINIEIVVSFDYCRIHYGQNLEGTQ